MRVLIADDHPLYREAVATQVRRLYGAARVDEAASMASLREMACAAGPPDLVLMDYYMPGMSAEDLVRLIGDFPTVPIVVMSGSASRTDVRTAIQAGARAYIPKTANPELFAHTLQIVLAGGTSIPAELLSDKAAGEDNGLAGLSAREREVLKGLARGQSNKEIGRELGLAEVTIKLHLRNIFRKLRVKNRAEAAIRAVKSGLG